MKVNVITPEECKAKIKEFTLVDVRGAEEFEGELGHIAGARLETLGEDLIERINDLKKDNKIVFICRSGRRSEMACLMALEGGYTNVYNLKGGMQLWNQLGLPIQA